MKTARTRIALLSLGQLNFILNRAGQGLHQKKGPAAEAVCSLYENGLLGLDDIGLDTPTLEVRPEPPKASQEASQDARDARLAAMAAQRQADEAARVAEAAGMAAKAAEAAAKAAEAAAKVRPDYAAQIDAMVRERFAEFREVVSEPEIREIAATMGTCTPAKARDVFPCCVYTYGEEVVDFGDMDVQLWGETSPILDDYVFPPAALHEALVALSHGVPDNVWLAGERGTGKTEFVTQLAARLQRPLVRVNFDEALERADFVGANTIEEGSVVWKAGVLAQAIQKPGALVLLDEVGFARPQALAVLHALCEPSQARALVIPETGEKICVAHGVAFFAADNSNGHGDNSGNFAGLKLQNSAFLDRFGLSLAFHYLPAKEEEELICRRTGLSPAVAAMLVQVANVARAKASAGVLTQPPSLRQLFAWARSVQGGVPCYRAFQSTVVRKFPADVEGELVGIYSACVDEAALKQAL